MALKDVTAEVRTGEIDGESLPVTRCLCGMEWEAWEGPILSVYGDDPYECPECHVKLFFSNQIIVYALAESVPEERTHEPGCPAIADDESDIVLDDYMRCVCKPLDKPEDPC